MKYLGIDPDLTSSGVAIWDSSNKAMDLLTNMPFYRLLAEISGFDGIVVIEAGWLNTKANFHSQQGAGQREKIAKNVGENHAVGKLLEEFCKLEGVKYMLYRPTRSKAVTNALFKAAGFWKGRSNQEMRDAAMIVYGL
jgi:hypothetical protein